MVITGYWMLGFWVLRAYLSGGRILLVLGLTVFIGEISSSLGPGVILCSLSTGDGEWESVKCKMRCPGVTEVEVRTYRIEPKLSPSTWRTVPFSLPINTHANSLGATRCLVE